MYTTQSSIDQININWKTTHHRTIAICALINNPKINTIEKLKTNSELINNIPENKIKQINYIELTKMGVPM